ncbi:hypothetical protein BN8_01953 [Fibrisoma limi BUZ 3]|uniref:Uncharacterized protein n=1 Tax=Fibrisoma limi BUZ 3 TaxID=1185876 RepID=I2GG87_9BACT|nr:hypothetical protein BN8_01953 [Fibrisoma limi BUZ 3]
MTILYALFMHRPGRFGRVGAFTNGQVSFDGN